MLLLKSRFLFLFFFVLFIRFPFDVAPSEIAKIKNLELQEFQFWEALCSYKVMNLSG